MDLAEIARVMRRRWYVLVPGLLATLALVAAVYVGVPTKYQSQSTVELLNSQKATQAFDGNPFLSTQTSLTGMADNLARSLNSDAAIADLKSQGLKGTYVAMIADNAQGPLLWLTVTGTDQAEVLNSDKLLTAYAGQSLQEFQAQQQVQPQAMIRMTTIVPPQDPVAQTKTKLEYLILASLLGIAGSMVLAFYVEARRRPRKAPAGEAAEELAPVVPGPDGDPDAELDADSDDGRPGADVGGEPQGVRPEPAARRRPRQDEDIEQPTVQLSVLQLPEQGSRAGADREDDSRAPWFAP